MGRSWDLDARPSKEMTPLKPEDHHLVQKVIQAGVWGQVGTIYEVMDEKAGALTVPPRREPCNMVNTFQEYWQSLMLGGSLQYGQYFLGTLTIIDAWWFILFCQEESNNLTENQ